MANLRIIASNTADSGTITVSPAVVSTLPEGNLKKSKRTKVMRTTGLADQVINYDWGGSSVPISGVVFSGHNLSPSGTIQCEIFDDQNNTGTLLYDSGEVKANPPKNLAALNWGVDPLGQSIFNDWDVSRIFSKLWFDQVKGKSMRVTMKDPTNSDGYMQMGRIYAGSYLSPEFGHTFPLSIEWKSTTRNERTDAGSPLSHKGFQYRLIEVPLKYIRPTERGVWLEVLRQIDISRDIFLSVLPEKGGVDERDFSMPCKLVNTVRQVLNSAEMWEMSLIFEEL